MVGEPHSDEELAQQIGGGDGAALAELYARYFGHVYDYGIRLSRDRDTAALVVQAAFLHVFQGLREGAPQAPFRLQLFAAAHYDAAERLRRRRGPAVESDEGFAVIDAGALGGAVPPAEAAELARVAWQSARDLRPDDY